MLEQKWFQQLLMPSAQGNIEGEMSRREAIRVAAASAQKGGAAPPPPPAAAAASAEDAKAASGGGGAAAEAAPAPKVVKEKPKFDDLVFHGIIGTGTFGRVKLVQQKTNDRVNRNKTNKNERITFA